MTVAKQIERAYDAISDARLDMDEAIDCLSNLDEHGEDRILTVRETMKLIDALREIKNEIERAMRELQ